MEDPSLSPSSPSTQRPPPKRWFILFGRSDGPWILAIILGIASLFPAIGFVICGADPWVRRAFGVVVGFGWSWCAAFLRRGHNPPKGSLVLDGDDE